MTKNKFLIWGRVIDSRSRNGIKDLYAEAWGKDLILHNRVGSTITDSQGRFQIEFDQSKFLELFLDRKPILFFKIYHGTELIKSTEDSILWNVDAGETELIIEVDPPSESTTETYKIEVTTRRPNGTPLGAIVSKAFDVDLRTEMFLGQATSDKQGRCSIDYDNNHLSRANKQHADLLVRAFAPDGELLRESEILFNAKPVEKVELVVDMPEQSAASEYGKLQKTLAPVVVDLPAANLSAKDIKFLLKKLDKEPLVDERRLRVFAESSRIARDSGLPADFLYGLAHALDLSLPLSMRTILEHDDESIRKGLNRAVDEKVVSIKLSESLDSYLARMERLKLDSGLLLKRNITGQLINEETGRPLRGFQVRASHLHRDEEPKDLGYDVTDKQGRFSFSIVRPPKDTGGAPVGPPEKLNLIVLDPQRNELYREEFEIGPELVEELEVKIPSERLPKPPVHSIESVTSESALKIPKELRSFFAEHSIETLEDVRRVGGLRRLENLPIAPDHSVIKALDAHANLSVLPLSAKENARLHEKGFNNISAIARTPRDTFANAVKEHFGLRKAAVIHATALTQTNLLNGFLTGIAVDLSNWRMPHMWELQPGALGDNDSESRVQPYLNIVSGNCSCRDCETAVSPGAYLADLLQYTISHVQDDGQVITLEDLANLLHQPFGDLPISCEGMEEQVRQVRICVEVLRHYRGFPLTDAKEEAYRLNAYETLLTKLGTSYEELVLARTADEETRAALANRLGIHVSVDPSAGAGSSMFWSLPEDRLAGLVLDPASITEEDLERLFGLADTTRHPLSDGLTRGDESQQVVRWQLNGIEWNWNTSDNGVIYVALSHPQGSPFRVDLYRDSARQQLVAAGRLSSPQGKVDLSPRNGSGLSGTMHLEYSEETDNIELIALPKLLTWRMQYLQTLWHVEDGISDLYAEVPPAQHTEAELLPVIDPDVIGPDDFRVPFTKDNDSDPNGPFDLWETRRNWIDDRLAEIRDLRIELTDDGQPDAEVIIALLQDVSRGFHFPRRWPADPREPTDMASVFRILIHNLLEGQDIEETQLHIQESLLTIDSFARLQEFHTKEEVVTEDEWEEVYSILVQAQKRFEFLSWRNAENNLQLPTGQILFSPRYFWTSLREPIEGSWPISEVEGPLIDPERDKLSDLPEPTAGYRAIAVWRARSGELDALSESIKEAHETGGSDGLNNMLALALGTPPPSQDWITYLSDLIDRMGQAEVSGIDEEREAIAEELEALHLDKEGLVRLDEVQRDPDSSEDDWSEVYAILTSCHKERELWDTWKDEEYSDPVLSSHYWLARKARLPQWRASAADRQAWQQALSMRSRLPVIDPDVVAAEYLRGMPPTAAFQLWEDREDWIREQIEEIRSNREQAPTELAGFDEILIGNLFDAAVMEQYQAQFSDIHDALGVDILVSQALGYSQEDLNLLLTLLDSTESDIANDAALTVPGKLLITVDDFRHLMDLLSSTAGPWEDAYTILARAALLASIMGLSREENQGINTTARLGQLDLTNAAFSHLLRVRELLESDIAIQDSDWESVYSIFVQVRKRRAFADWRVQEQKDAITLSPNQFQLPVPSAVQFPPPEPPALPAWRANWRDLRAWRDTLDARIDQLATVVSALKEAISATEVTVLPKLRDALILASNVSGTGLSAKADTLANLLLIDTKVSGCQLTTRVSQAITTILELLWKLRTRQLQSIYPDLVLIANNFDEEWKWIGEYVNWRAAMFIHLYPENLLTPTLRVWRTPGFEQLVKTINSQSLTPDRACLAAQAYSEYFEDVCTLTIEATCYGETRIYNEESCGPHAIPITRTLFYMFGIGGKTGRLYWSAIDPEDENSRSQSFWAPLTGLDDIKPSRIVGSVPYRKTDDQRFIVLVILAEELDETQLLVTKYNLGTNTWDSQPIPLEIPDIRMSSVSVFESEYEPDVRIGSIVAVQSEFEDEPPRLALHLEGHVPMGFKCDLFVRSLNPKCDNWDQAEYTNEQEEAGGTEDDWLRYRVYEDEFLVSLEGDVLHAAIFIRGNESVSAGDLFLCFSRRLTILSEPLLYVLRIRHYREPMDPADVVRGVDEMDEVSRRLWHGIWFGAIPVPQAIDASTRWMVYGKTPQGQLWRVPSQPDLFSHGPELFFPAPEVLHRCTEVVPVYGPVPGLGTRLAVYRLEPRIGSRLGSCSWYPNFSIVTYHFGGWNLGDDWYSGHLGEQSRRHANPECPPYCPPNPPTIGDLTDPFDITPNFSATELQDRRALLHRVYGGNHDESEFILSYLEEAYYFVPIQLAMQLQQDGYYVEALDWLRTVYDYGAESDTRKIAHTLMREDSLIDEYQRAGSWLLELNPHQIARTRGQPYTSFTVLVLVRLLLAYADAEFTHDTAETVQRATSLYRKALDLLHEHQLLRLSSHTCEDMIAELVIAVGEDAEAEAPSAKALLKDIVDGLSLINSPGDLTDVLSNVNSAIEGEGPLTKRLTDALHVVHDNVNFLSKDVEGVLAGQEEKTDTAYSLLLTDSFIAEKTIDTALLVESRSPRFFEDESNAPSENNEDEPELVNILDLVAMWTPGLYEYQPTIFLDFCIPPNPVWEALRLRAELNLYKIRTCRNIAGMERQLEPYSAPTDASSGLPTIGGNGEIVLPGTITFHPTPYRYQALIERAKEFTQIAAKMESAMLSAMEKHEEQLLRTLEAQQGVELTQQGIRLQDLRVNEAEDGVTLAELQRDRAQILVETYEEWITGGLNEYENDLLEAYDLLGKARATMASFDIAMSSAQAFATAKGVGGLIYAGIWAAQATLKGAAQILAIRREEDIQRATLFASHERRKDEWKLQKAVSEQDILIGEQQVKLSQDHVQVVGKERQIAEMQAEHAKEVADFLANKFLNADLYLWMMGVLQDVYSFFLQQATALARLAENQVAFERQGLPTSYIQTDYWQAPAEIMTASGMGEQTPDRRGLTGSSRLLQDIYELDQYAFDTDKRKLQISKTISLASLAPWEFQRFRETGVMPFSTPMRIFDRDFPGHYLRLIKQVRISVIALIPPVSGIHSRLTSNGLSRVVIGADGVFQETMIRRPPESIALSAPINATGLFEMTPEAQQMLLPFEGLGVATDWEYQMPRAANLFDYDTIADVLISIDYTALEDFSYRQQVIRELDDTVSADRPFSFRYQFADQWYDLHNPDQSATPMTVRFETRRQDFPANLDELKITNVLLYFSRKEGASFEIPVRHLRFTEHGSAGNIGGAATSPDGVISTGSGNASSWVPMIGQSTIGQWELALPNTREIRARFQNDEIEDILFVLTYSGRTPPYSES